jgi:hypothetical protein
MFVPSRYAGGLAPTFLTEILSSEATVLFPFSSANILVRLKSMPSTLRSRVKTLSRKLGRAPTSFTIQELQQLGVHVPRAEQKNAELFA